MEEPIEVLLGHQVVDLLVVFVGGAGLGEFAGAVFPGGVEVDLSEHVDQLCGDREVFAPAAGRLFGVHNDNIRLISPLPIT